MLQALRRLFGKQPAPAATALPVAELTARAAALRTRARGPQLRDACRAVHGAAAQACDGATPLDGKIALEFEAFAAAVQAQDCAAGGEAADRLVALFARREEKLRR